MNNPSFMMSYFPSDKVSNEADIQSALAAHGRSVLPGGNNLTRLSVSQGWIRQDLPCGGLWGFKGSVRDKDDPTFMMSVLPRYHPGQVYRNQSTIKTQCLDIASGRDDFASLKMYQGGVWLCSGNSHSSTSLQCDNSPFLRLGHLLLCLFRMMVPFPPIMLGPTGSYRLLLSLRQWLSFIWVLVCLKIALRALPVALSLFRCTVTRTYRQCSLLFIGQSDAAKSTRCQICQRLAPIHLHQGCLVVIGFLLVVSFKNDVALNLVALFPYLPNDIATVAVTIAACLSLMIPDATARPFANVEGASILTRKDVDVVFWGWYTWQAAPPFRRSAAGCSNTASGIYTAPIISFTALQCNKMPTLDVLTARALEVMPC